LKIIILYKAYVRILEFLHKLYKAKKIIQELWKADSKKNFSEDEIRKRTIRIQEAREKYSKERSSNTEKNDKIVLDCLERYQKLTLKQIKDIFSKSSKRDTFKRSFLINSLKRLENKGLIFSRTSNETIHGKLTKFYYKKLPEDFNYTKIIIGEKDYFTFLDQNPTAYAMEDNKIIISSENSKECINEKKFSYPMIVKKENNSSTVILQLPNEFIKFYKLIPGEYYFDYIFSKDKITLIKIRNIKSDERESSLKKIVLVLEDHPGYGKKIKKKLIDKGHEVILTIDVEQFLNKLKKYNRKIDVISLDNAINKEDVAEKLSYEIRHYAPQAKIGLLTKNLEEDEKEQFQVLNFHYILPKRRKSLTGFSNVLDELSAWVAAA